MGNLNLELPEIAPTILDLAKKEIKGERVINLIRQTTEAEYNKEEEAINELLRLIKQEQEKPTAPFTLGGLKINVVDAEKIKALQWQVAKHQEAQKAILKFRERSLQKKEGLLFDLITGSEEIKQHGKKILEIKKALDKKDLPYLAVVPDGLLETMVKDFDLFHFRDADFAEPDFFDTNKTLLLTLPQGKIHEVFNAIENSWSSDKIEVGMEAVSQAYQGKISYCFKGTRNCSNCSKISCMAGRGFQDSMIFEWRKKIVRYQADIMIKEGWKKRLVNCRENVRALFLEVSLPEVPFEVQKKLNRWIETGYKKHFFTIAAPDAVRVKEIFVPGEKRILSWATSCLTIGE